MLWLLCEEAMMSYAIIRNTKYKMSNLLSVWRHNEIKNKNYDNNYIYIEKTDNNYHLKEPIEKSYEREFNRIRKENDLKGNLRLSGVKQSNIACEFFITSDNDFFKDMSFLQIQNFFQESYTFIKRKCGEKNIISSVIHLDETTPHMHVLYIPVVSKKNTKGEMSDRINCSEFWKGYNSYGIIQDQFYEHCKNKGYKLERGKVGSKSEHLAIADYKLLTKQQELQIAINTSHTLEEKYSSLKEKKEALENDICNLSKGLKGKALDVQQIISIQPKKGIAGSIKDISMDQVEDLKKMAIQGLDYKYMAEILEIKIDRSHTMENDSFTNTKKEHDFRIEIINLKSENEKLQYKIEMVEQIIKENPEFKIAFKNVLGKRIDK